MKTIEERALELYPVKEVQLGNYMEDMNGLARMSYIRGAEKQQKIDAKLIATYFSGLMADIGYVPKNMKEE